MTPVHVYFVDFGCMLRLTYRRDRTVNVSPMKIIPSDRTTIISTAGCPQHRGVEFRRIASAAAMTSLRVDVIISIAPRSIYLNTQTLFISI